MRASVPCRSPAARRSLGIVAAALRYGKREAHGRVVRARSPATAAEPGGNGTADRNGNGEQRCESGKLRELSPDGYGAQPTDKAQLGQAARHAGEPSGQTEAEPDAEW